MFLLPAQSSRSSSPLKHNQTVPAKSSSSRAAAGFLTFNVCFYCFRCFLRCFFFLLLFHEQSSKMCTQHSPLEECGGVLHDDCNTRLAWLMVARCAGWLRPWKNMAPPDGYRRYYTMKGREPSRGMMGKRWVQRLEDEPPCGGILRSGGRFTGPQEGSAPVEAAVSSSSQTLVVTVVELRLLRKLLLLLREAVCSSEGRRGFPGRGLSQLPAVGLCSP